jgi:hypothetical protein
MLVEVAHGSNASVQLSRRVGFTPDSGRIAERHRTDASGPIASLRTAEKQRAFCPWDHREVGRRPADWRMIPFPTLERVMIPLARGSNGDQHWKAAIYIRARQCGRRAAACGARAAAGDAGDRIPQLGSV